MQKTHSALFKVAFCHGFPVALPLIWAGVSLGGKLVTAPAKFQVAALEMPVALQVGRAQFTWIAYIEWAILAAIFSMSLVQLKRPAPVLIAAVFLFLFQQFWMQPALQARSDLIIAGATAGESHLHLIYIAAEPAKFF